jgi:uncharacterized protein DUF6788
MTTSLKALRGKRDQLTGSLAHIDDLRPGFLTARFRKCGKANCHCAHKDSPGHGPSYSLTHHIGGKTVTQVIPQGPAVERAKAQIAEYRRFRSLVRELIAVSEQICSASLRARLKKNLFADLLASDIVQEIEILTGCLHYFETNRDRMRYPEFHAQGLCTSTGVVEAGCKVAIGTRLKRAGMRWAVRGSNAIIALRCAKLSGRFQDFWERRTERRAA